MEVRDGSSPEALVSNSLLCLPGPPPCSSLDKTPVGFTRTLPFVVEVANLALSHEPQGTPLSKQILWLHLCCAVTSTLWTLQLLSSFPIAPLFQFLLWSFVELRFSMHHPVLHLSVNWKISNN